MLSQSTHIAGTHLLCVAFLQSLNFLLLTLQHLIPNRLTQHHRLWSTHDTSTAVHQSTTNYKYTRYTAPAERSNLSLGWPLILAAHNWVEWSAVNDGWRSLVDYAQHSTLRTFLTDNHNTIVVRVARYFTLRVNMHNGTRKYV